MITAEDLRVASEFADIDQERLEWLAGQFEEIKLAKGEEPFEANSSADQMLVLVEGSMQVFFPRGGAWHLLDTLGPGRVTGLLPYSRMKSFAGRATAVEPMRIATLHRDLFPEMLYRIPELGQRLIGLMSDRVRSQARYAQEQEKMLALGKLSAGLAHELNNPAAAVRRAADDLKNCLHALPAIVARLARHGLDPARVNPAGGFCTVGGGGRVISAVELSNREDEILDWLEDRELDEAWRIAPTLAEAGITPADLDLAVKDVADSAIPDVIAWIENSLGSNRLLEEIHAAASRISSLVGSVKSYSHMDRSTEKKATRLADGIETTLTMLGHKIKKKAIAVNLELDESMPEVPAHEGELNQVWTNIIDNAVDAMPEGGSLTVRARRIGEMAEVRILDNGHGIPEDVLPRIFEPFFSTKDVGQGTGLGLEIVHRIITKQHAGKINVVSTPGETVFTIQLPLQDVAAVG